MTDETDSIYGKIFVREDDDLNTIMKAINNKSWYKISGQVKYDEYEFCQVKKENALSKFWW